MNSIAQVIVCAVQRGLTSSTITTEIIYQIILHKLKKCRLILKSVSHHAESHDHKNINYLE